MLDPASQSGLIIPEGMRAKQIYHAHRQDARTSRRAPPRGAAKHADLGLPAWADGNPEGLPLPLALQRRQGRDPADVLEKMVERAKAEYAKIDLEAQAKKAGKTPEQIVIIASLVQAEAQEHEDFGKVSRVIYNRLDQNMLLGFDSTINYAKGRSTLDTSIERHRGRLALQHLHAPRPAARAHRQPRTRGHRGGAASRPRATGSTSSRSSPATPASPRARPSTSATSRTSTRNSPSGRGARRLMRPAPHGGRRVLGSPDRPLPLARCCTAPPTPHSD